MSTDLSLSPRVRMLMFAATAGFALLGLVMFLAPAWSAAHFAWSISPMVAMTMGGWYLGSAAMCGLAAMQRPPSRARAALLYVMLFTLAEAGVLLAHAGSVQLSSALTWPYILTLALALIASLSSVAVYLSARSQVVVESPPVPLWVRGIGVLFVIFVGFLAAVALSGSSAGLYGSIFPEPLSPFTLQSFGAFYFALAASALAVVRARGMPPITVYVQGGMVLIVLITLAAFVHWQSFNLAAYPRQIVYPAVYVAAGAAGSAYLFEAARRSRHRA